jgi:hypothetical protein
MQSLPGTFDVASTRIHAGGWRSGDWRGLPATH